MKIQWPFTGDKWKLLWKRYQYPILVVALGVVLLLLPSAEKKETASKTTPTGEKTFQLEEFETKLQDTLSRVQGAGEVQVVLSVDSGSRQVLAQDQQREGDRASSSTVTINQGSGSQEVVPLQTMAPKFRGALVVCSGGNDPQVRLQLLRAVSALTGLGANNICICQSEP